MADENSGYKISDRLLRLSTPRKYVSKADGGEGSPRSSSAAASSTSPHKVMTHEQLEASCNRMYSQTRKTKELPPIVISKKMTKEEEEKSVVRLYRDAMEVREKKRAMSAAKVAKKEKCETKVVPQEEIEELVKRVYDNQAELKKKKQELLEKKYASRPSTSSEKRLSKEEVAGMGARLCTESTQAIQASKASLYEKYVLSRLPKGAPMDSEELKDASNRLYRNEPRA